MTASFTSTRRTLCTVVLLCVAAAINEPALASGHVYVTWAGAEPDKGACAWYIKRKIDVQAEFVVVPHGAPLPEGTPFDVPQSDFRRTHNASAFQSLLRTYPNEDPVIEKLAALTHDIEINLWRPKIHPETVALQQRIREVEAGFGAGGIPMSCFISFFDEVYEWLKARRADAGSLTIPAACQAGSSVASDAAAPDGVSE